MKPLLAMSSPPIDKEQVKTLFGPIGDLMAHHELFYTALTQKSMNWGPKQLVGSVFMTVSSLVGIWCACWHNSELGAGRVHFCACLHVHSPS